jgi:hypothetical protein
VSSIIAPATLWVGLQPDGGLAGSRCVVVGLKPDLPPACEVAGTMTKAA